MISFATTVSKNLYEGVNVSQTIEKVIKELGDYQQAKLTLECNNLPSITAAYELVSTGPNNQFHSKVESHVEETEQLQETVNRVVNAINRLEFEDRKLIYEKYIASREVQDKHLATKLNYSSTTYYRKRKKALVALGHSLKVVVYDR
jgi:ArpU family phage transcriptional regulator